MKRSIFTFMLLVPLIGNAQAHLGISLQEIKSYYPDKIFTIDYTNSGQKYASTEMYYGTFVYYFDAETGLSQSCIQIPHNMTALNAQVEIYNAKYVIVSETSWKAYLEGGGIMKIKLSYEDEYGIYVFSYTN